MLFRDITARKQAEAACGPAKLWRERTSSVCAASACGLAAGAIIGTWLWDLPTNRFTVDEAFAGHFGLDPALGRIGLSLEQVIANVHSDDRPGLIAAINEAIACGVACAHQYRARRADGRYYWIEAKGRIDHAQDGTPLSFLSS